MNLMDYVPAGMITALGGIVAWVGNDHMKRDDARFSYMAAAIEGLSAKQDAVVRGLGDKLDTAIAKQSSNHAEILTLMLTAKEVATERARATGI